MVHRISKSPLSIEIVRVSATPPTSACGIDVAYLDDHSTPQTNPWAHRYTRQYTLALDSQMSGITNGVLHRRFHKWKEEMVKMRSVRVLERRLQRSRALRSQLFTLKVRSPGFQCGPEGGVVCVLGYATSMPQAPAEGKSTRAVHGAEIVFIASKRILVARAMATQHRRPCDLAGALYSCRTRVHIRELGYANAPPYFF